MAKLCGVLSLCALVLAATYTSLFFSHHGKAYVAGVAGCVRPWVVSFFPAELALLLGAELPLFVASGGDRLTTFQLYESQFGHAFPFMHGVAVTKHAEVKATLLSADQRRGKYLGAQLVPEACLDPELLIFLSTSDAHSRIRSFFRTIVPVFNGSADAAGAAALIDSAVPVDAPLSVVKAELVRALWTQFWGKAPTYADVEVLVQYFTFGGTCVLGPTLHTLTASYLLGRVQHIRSYAVALAATTPVGQAFLTSTEPGINGTTALRWAVDGVLFAGMFGTSHLTTHTLERIRTNPGLYVPMWQRNPTTFLLESARVDPPVTSVTNVLSAAETRTMPHIGSVTYPAGATKVLILGTANRDPDVFGGAAKSAQRAAQFDPTRRNLNETLSWNGVEGLMGSSPRGCPAHDYSITFATALINRFLPAASQPVANATAAAAAHSDSIVTSTLTSLDQVGYLIWGAVCLLASLYLRFWVGLGPLTYYYEIYVLSQTGLSIAVLAGIPAAMSHCMAMAACAYLCVAGLYFGVEFRAAVAAVWALTTTCIVWLFHVLPSQHAGPASLLVAETLYGPAAAAAIITIFHAGWKHGFTAAHGVNVAVCAAVVGGTFGVADLFWPSLIANGKYFNILSRVADSTLYVPLVVPGLLWLDELPRFGYKATELRKLKTSSQHFLRLVIVALLVALLASSVQTVLDSLKSFDVCADQASVSLSGIDASVCEERYLQSVDGHTATMFGVLKRGIVASRDAPAPGADTVGIPTHQKTLPKKLVTGGVPIPTEDEDYPVKGFAGHAMAVVRTAVDELLRSQLFPLIDEPTARWVHPKQGALVMQTAIGPDLPPMLTHWSEMTSDDSLSKLVFSGIAAHTITRAEPQVIVSDFEWLSGLPTRPGYAGYGGLAKFNATTGAVLSITVSGVEYLPGGVGWEHAKWTFKASALVGVTLRDHLVTIHLMAANVLTTAVAERLPPSHPLRRFLKPHTYGTVSINVGASTYLLEELGLLHRAVGLTWDALVAGVQYSFKAHRYNVIANNLAARGVADLPPELSSWGDDLTAFESVVARYVKGYVDIYWPTDDAVFADAALLDFWEGLHMLPDSHIPQLSKDTLTTVIGDFIVLVTGFHLSVGTVGEYLRDPQHGIGAKVQSGTVVSDVQASFQAVNIALMTASKAPMLCGNYEHLLLQDEHFGATTALMRRFQSELSELSDTISSANSQRRFPTNAFNPRLMTSSVSI